MAGSSAQDDAGSTARAAGRFARAAEGDTAAEGRVGSSATAAAVGSTAPAAGRHALASGARRAADELGPDDRRSRGARRIRTDDGPDSERATYCWRAPGVRRRAGLTMRRPTGRPLRAIHRGRMRPGRSAGRPAAAGTSTALSRLLLKCNASEIRAELGRRQLRTAGFQMHEAVDVLAASQPMATERQAAYMESIVLRRGRRAGEEAPRLWMRHLLTTAAASQWINGWM